MIILNEWHKPQLMLSCFMMMSKCWYSLSCCCCYVTYHMLHFSSSSSHRNPFLFPLMTMMIPSPENLRFKSMHSHWSRNYSKINQHHYHYHFDVQMTMMLIYSLEDDVEEQRMRWVADGMLPASGIFLMVSNSRVKNCWYENHEAQRYARKREREREIIWNDLKKVKCVTATNEGQTSSLSSTS